MDIEGCVVTERGSGKVMVGATFVLFFFFLCGEAKIKGDEGERVYSTKE